LQNDNFKRDLLQPCNINLLASSWPCSEKLTYATHALAYRILVNRSEHVYSLSTLLSVICISNCCPFNLFVHVYLTVHPMFVLLSICMCLLFVHLTVLPSIRMCLLSVYLTILPSIRMCLLSVYLTILPSIRMCLVSVYLTIFPSFRMCLFYVSDYPSIYLYVSIIYI
jgi:hypothetical protein